MSQITDNLRSIAAGIALAKLTLVESNLTFLPSMLAITHAAIASAETSLILGTAEPLALRLAIIGSQLPDIDTTTSTIGLHSSGCKIFFPISSWIEDRFPHRSITHSLLATVAIASGRGLCRSPLKKKFDRVRKSGAMTDKLHQNYELTIRDINWGEQEIYLRVNRRQMRCDRWLAKISRRIRVCQEKTKLYKTISEQNNSRSD